MHKFCACLLKRNNTVKTNKKRFSRVLRNNLSSLKHNVLKVMSRRDRRIQDPPYRRGIYRTGEKESCVRKLTNSYKIGDVTIYVAKVIKMQFLDIAFHI